MIQRTLPGSWALDGRTLVAGLVVLAGCVGHVRSYPLYPNPQARRDAATVARLTGIVATVDGVDVASHGDTFDLAPGCHVVTLPRTLGQGGEHEPWSVDVPRVVFAFKMSGGHAYVIEHQVHMGSDRNGSVTVTATERDRNGATIATVAPSRGAQDIQDCRERAPSQQPTP